MKYFYLVVVGVMGFSIAGNSAPISKEAKQDLKRPVNCAYAEGDLRVLEAEKAHVGKQAAAGVSAIAPIGLVSGLIMGTEKDKIEVATGEYNKHLEAKIAEIKKTCGR